MSILEGHCTAGRSQDTLAVGPLWVSSVMTTTVSLHCKPWPCLPPSPTYIPSSQGTLSDLRTNSIELMTKTELWVSRRLTLMSYYGVVLLLLGYQADETHILKQYRAIVDKVAGRFPLGSLWILNRVNLSSGRFLCHFIVFTGKNIADVIRRRRSNSGFTGWVGNGEEEQVQAGRFPGDPPPTLSTSNRR